jgi:hypothetical protein
MTSESAEQRLYDDLSKTIQGVRCDLKDLFNDLDREVYRIKQALMHGKELPLGNSYDVYAGAISKLIAREQALRECRRSLIVHHDAELRTD